METIKSSEDISCLFANGRRIHTPYLTLIVLPQQHDRSSSMCGRVAFIAGKKLGNAVWRNSAKRRMRALARDLGGPWPAYDVVFLAKKKTTSAQYAEIVSYCEKALRRDGRLVEQPQE